MGQAICVLSEEDAREVLLHLYDRVKSVRKLAEMLGLGKSSVHRILRGEQAPPLVLRVKLCETLPPEELIKVLKGGELLRRYGLADDEGRLNKPLAFALVDALLQNELYREELLSYLLRYYKRELLERLEEALPRVELR